MQRSNRRGRCEAGFTLMEVIVALGVLSVGISVFVNLYTHSLDLARVSSDTTLATQLAESRLEEIIAEPAEYLWAIPDAYSAARFPIAMTAEDPNAGNPFAPPTTIPTAERANNRMVAEYDRFRWKAYGRLPEPEATHYEVTVVVRWTHDGRERGVALTAAVARDEAPAPTVVPPAPVETAEPTVSEPVNPGVEPPASKVPRDQDTREVPPAEASS